MKQTAFVSHEDCSRHDTGWNHPDHQGRLPAIARAVYRDMLTLFEPLLELSATPATPADLGLIHDAAYLARIEATSAEAARRGEVLSLDGVPVSGATWEAVLAAAGAAITAANAVLNGDVRNAFVLARPPGRDAGPAMSGGYSLVNTVAIAARHLRQRRGCGRVVVLAWGAHPPAGLAECLADDPDCVVVSVHPASHAVPADPVPGIAASIALAPGSGAAALETATRTVLDPAGPADFLLVSAGFEILTGDQADGLQVGPDDVHALTLTLIAEAGRLARGRIVSVLEGGYAAAPLGRAVVQHLRALAGLQPA